MARYCNICNKKINFFEETFDGMCKNCYNEYLVKLEEENKKQEELERRKLEEEKKKQEELERKKLEEEKKKQEELEKKKHIQNEKRRKEREKKRKQKLAEQKKQEMEEQKKIKEELKQKQLEEKQKKQEELNKKREEKSNIHLNKIKNKILENPIVFLEYIDLFDNISNTKNKLNIFLPEYQNLNTIFLSMFSEIMKTAPVNYSISYIAKMTSFNNTIKIMQQLKYMIKDSRQIIKENINRIPNSRKLNDNYNVVVGAKKYKYFYDPNQEIINIDNIVDTIVNDKDSINIKIDDKISKIDNDISKLKSILTEKNKQTYFDWCFRSYADLNSRQYEIFEDDDDGILAKYEYSMRRFLGLQTEMNIMFFEYLYNYVITALYILKICEYSSNIENNSEISQILENLESSKIDRVYIADKFYSFYEQFYNNLFKENLTKADIYCIIYLIEKKTAYDKVKIDDAENYIKNSNINININDNLCTKVKIIEKFIVNFYETNLNNKNLFDEKYIKKVILLTFGKYKEYFEFKDLFDLIRYFKEIKTKILSLEKNLYLNSERLRLLNGDLSKELKIKEQKFDLNAVNNGYDFEEYVANLFKELGYTLIEVTKKSGDQGADIVLQKENKKYVIQTKFYSSPVGNKAVQEIVASLSLYKAQYGIVVTNNSFTNSAIELATANNIQLIDGNELNNLKKKILENN